MVYEIYLRSFADSDGDGLGDLAGLRSRLPHLADLGIDAVWLCPFYPSPLADGGYDVADYRDVDPRLGSLSDFDGLIADAHGVGIKVIIDIVPNHTSGAHPWFREALGAAPGTAARDRYLFFDGSGPNGDDPPSDWRSHFGGPAWQRVPDGQWYCHLFTREQPDLNWANGEVQRYFADTLRFWGDRGVDGFRVDMAHTLAKDLSIPLRSQTNLDLALPNDGTDPLYDRDEVHSIYEQWRTVFDEYDPPLMAVAETWHSTSERTYLYARPSELGQVFDFSLSKCSWNRDEFGAAIRRSLDHHRHGGGGLTWVLSSHDMVRHASRLALPGGTTPDEWLLAHGADPAIDPMLGRHRAAAATMLMLALPGSPYLYQGEELGLPEVADLDIDVLHDPTWHRSAGARKGRDGCRVPLPWRSGGQSFGFGPRGSWLPQPEGFGTLAAEVQHDDPTSMLSLYRRAITLRRGLQTDDNEVEWLELHDPRVVHIRRSNHWQCVTNFSHEPVPLPAGHVVLSSRPLFDGALPGDASAWIIDDQ